MIVVTHAPQSMPPLEDWQMQRAVDTGNKQQSKAVNFLHGEHPSSVARLRVLAMGSVHRSLQWKRQGTVPWGLAGGASSSRQQIFKKKRKREMVNLNLAIGVPGYSHFLASQLVAGARSDSWP